MYKQLNIHIGYCTKFIKFTFPKQVTSTTIAFYYFSGGGGGEGVLISGAFKSSGGYPLTLFIVFAFITHIFATHMCCHATGLITNVKNFWLRDVRVWLDLARPGQMVQIKDYKAYQYTLTTITCKIREKQQLTYIAMSIKY